MRDGKLKFLYLLLMIFLVACETAPVVEMGRLSKRSEDYRVAKFKPPARIVKKLKPRVVVLPFVDESGVSQCNLAAIATDTVHNVVASSGSYRLVERAQAKAIAKELGYQETHGASWEDIEKKYFSLGRNIDYAIVGSITSARIAANAKNVVAEVEMNVRVIDLSKGETVQSFTVKGSESRTMTAGLNPCDVIRSALKDAIECPLLVKLRTSIPQYGYVREVRSYTKDGKLNKVLFVNLGSSDGLRPGDKVKVIRIERFVDPITKKVSIRYVEIGEGVVAKNGLLPQESMILVSDPVVVKEVKIGYLVRPTAFRVESKCQTKKFLQSLGIILNQLGGQQ